MIGLMVLLGFGVYFIISSWVIHKTASWAERNNRSPRKWGWLAVFVMYNLVFWDLIPTLIAHKYYCDTQAGFWVYKTPEEWKQENQEMVKTLVATPLKSEKLAKTENLGNEWVRYWINQRLYFEVKRKRNFLHAIWFEERQLVDASNQRPLAKVVSFSRGVGGALLATGGTLDEFRQALILSWGDRNCMSDRKNLIDSFSMSLHNYYTREVTR